jgi:hypothetical protein
MRLTEKLRLAAVRYLALQSRSIHPRGNRGGGGPWYPCQQFDCCANIRSPSWRWPWSLMNHCRTMPHVANETGIEIERLKWAVNRIKEEKGQ